MCDDTACEYGALVGGECGSSTKYPSIEYMHYIQQELYEKKLKVKFRF